MSRTSVSVDALLEVRDLVKRYGDIEVIRSISFDVQRGEIFTLLGQSGCGKSTTLKLVAGLERPDGGTVAMRGRPVAAPRLGIFVQPERRNLGMVFQSSAVWPHMTVGENVSYPLRIRGTPRAEITTRVRQVCDLVALSAFLDRPVTQLSGGQQQRVALARALVYAPDLLLLDEPFSNLDAKLREELREQFKNLHERLDTTILYVTHDQTEAITLSSRVAVMRNGAIEQLGTPREIYEQPVNPFVQNFLGRVVSFAGEVIGASHEATTVRLVDEPSVILAIPDCHAGAKRGSVTIRPEDIRLECGGSADAATIMGRVRRATYAGDHYDCTVEAAGSEIAVRLPKSAEPQPGAVLPLHLDGTKIRFWGEA